MTIEDKNAEQFSEEIEVDCEYIYMLKYSVGFITDLEGFEASAQFISEERPYRIKLTCSDSTKLKIAKEMVFSNAIYKILALEIYDDEVKYLFDGRPNHEYKNYNNDIFQLFGGFHSSQAYVPKNIITESRYKGKNVLFVRVLKSRVGTLQESFKKVFEELKKNPKLVVMKKQDVVERKEDVLYINRYIELGQELSKTPETSNFKRLIESIDDNQSPFDGIEGCTLNTSRMVFSNANSMPPFVFVCASSGTGKTQLPFSLNIPLIYLIYNRRMIDRLVKEDIVSKTQSIYTQFATISSAFLDCIKRDCEILSSQQADKLDDKITAGPLFTPGFFVFICENIVKIRQTYDQEHWAISELRIPGDDMIQKMDITVAYNRIANIFNDKKRNKPVVFLDESQRTEMEDWFTREYKYVRRVIRMLGLIPVFMGTNASLSNFVNIDGADGSRDDVIFRPWCYVVYKLAETSQKYLQEERKNTSSFIENYLRANKNLKEQAYRFFDVLLNLMKRERPLFCNLVFDFLKSETKIWDKATENGRFNSIFMLEEILHHIFTTFNKAKKDFSTYNENDCFKYNFANISLTSPEFWRKSTNARRLSTTDNISSPSKKNRLTEFEKCEAIHNHIAHLYVPREFEIALGKSNFFPVGIDRSGLKMLGNIPRDSTLYDFKKEQIFAPFVYETIGEIAYIGPKNFNEIFIGKYCRSKDESDELKPYCRVSSSYALHEIIDYKVFCRNYAMNNSINWTSIELATSLSALVASNYSGFSGMKFGLWLSCFLRELNVKSSYVNDILPSITFPEEDEFCKVCQSLEIPFCSPTINADWSKDFMNYLISCGANIGTVYADLKNEKRDFYIKRSCDGSIPISGECKYRQKGVDKACVLEIISDLVNFKSPINLIVVNELKNVKKWIRGDDPKSDGMQPGICLYHLKSCNGKYSLDPLYKSTRQCLYGFILIEFGKINPHWYYPEEDILKHK